MNESGAERADLLVQSRAAMLDALAALEDHREAVIVIGAQAVYLQTSAAPVALAEATKDSDLALDPRDMPDEPLLEDAMTRAGFYPNPNRQPGAWCNPNGIPVDLMVPEALAGPRKKTTRGARIPPHSASATRRAAGLEAALVDNSPMAVTALDPADRRQYSVKVAGCAALLVAKLHKIGERADDPNPDRLRDKDAHDTYRILIDAETADLAEAFDGLLRDDVTTETTRQALAYLQGLFADGPTALGSTMAGRAETGIGEPETVSRSVSLLATALLKALQTDARRP